tara:strand:+ start:134 stop:544 length:411 start_codon:yes stop_codon:yes gene_type:complete
MFEEIKNIKTTKKDLKSFGIIFGIIFFITAAYLFSKNNEIYTISIYSGLFFAIIALIIPSFLKPIYIVWMVFGLLLGWLMTRIILGLLFYIIITPIAILVKILGKDFLDLKNVNKNSYWNKRDIDIELNQDYRKQF